MSDDVTFKSPEGSVWNFRIVKPGAEVVKAAKAVLDKIMQDESDLRLYYDKSARGDPEFSGTREFPGLLLKAVHYQDKYKVESLSSLDKLIRRYRFVVDHFQAEAKYEFTIDQLVELGF